MGWQDFEKSDAQFATTHWSLVERIRAGDETSRAAALEVMCKRYWSPVYAYARRSGRGPEAAAELTQGFFADVVLWRDLFARAESERGRFRSLVLASLKRYSIDQHRRVNAARAVPLDEESIGAEERLLRGQGEPDADQMFEKRWALAVVQEALAACEQQFSAMGKRGHWGLFEDRVLLKARGHETQALGQLAVKWGFASAPAAGAALQVVRDRLEALLSEAARESGMQSPVEILDSLA